MFMVLFNQTKYLMKQLKLLQKFSQEFAHKQLQQFNIFFYIFQIQYGPQKKKMRELYDREFSIHRRYLHCFLA